MEKAFDVVALGELLIDFTEHGTSEQGNPLWEANPGGAPCNVLAMLNKLERRTAFIGKVGNDVYGRQLRAVVSEAGIDTSALLDDPAVHTTLAVVHTFENGAAPSIDDLLAGFTVTESFGSETDADFRGRAWLLRKD